MHRQFSVTMLFRKNSVNYIENGQFNGVYTKISCANMLIFTKGYDIM